MGCAHFYLKKPVLATLYFQKAIELHKINIRKFIADFPDEIASDKPLFVIGTGNITSYMYNLGLSLLHSGKPTEAFDCLTEVVQVYHLNPRVWIRLAECCITVHKSGNEIDFDYIKKRKDILRAVIGYGQHRKLILNLRLFNNNKYSYDAQSFAIPVASLEFATLCLRNALLLLSNDQIDFSPSCTTAIQKTNAILKVSALTTSAYVALCIGDPLVALSHTRVIFNLPNCPGIYKLLAHLYSAEAYLMLNKIPEAIEHLRPDYCNYVANKEENESFWNPIKTYKPDSPTALRTVILYNLAVMYTIKGQLNKANELLKQIIFLISRVIVNWSTIIASTWSAISMIWLIKSAPRCEVPVQTISLTLYIELASGRIDVAKSIIKQHCPLFNIKQ